jgi:hypothetical protein
VTRLDAPASLGWRLYCIERADVSTDVDVLAAAWRAEHPAERERCERTAVEMDRATRRDVVAMLEAYAVGCSPYHASNIRAAAGLVSRG